VNTLLDRAVRRPWSLFAVLVIVLAVLRSASLAHGAMDNDEALWTLCGRLLLRGAVPYVDFVDHKPPLLFYLYALFGTLGGGSLIAIHGLVLLWVACSALVLGAVVREHGTKREAAATALAYALLSSCNAVSGSSEILADLPIAIACLFAVKGARGRGGFFFLAGAFASLAALIRPQSVLVGIAIAGWIVFERVRREQRSWLAGLSAFAIGTATPIAATVALFYAAGALGALWEWNVQRNFGYPAPADWGMLLLESALVCVALGAGWAWWLAGRRIWGGLRGLLPGKAPEAPTVVLGSLLALTGMISVCIGRRFYHHYFLQLALPLSLLAGPRVAALFEPTVRRGVRRALAMAMIVPALGFAIGNWARAGLGRYPDQDPRSQALVEWLKSPEAPAGRIALWGDTAHIYHDSGRLPATRYCTAKALVGLFDPSLLPSGFDFSPYLSSEDISRWMEDVAGAGPILLVDASSGPIHDWDRFPIKKIAPLWRYVRENLRLIARPGGVAVYGP
jgi:hypothetical protein